MWKRMANCVKRWVILPDQKHSVDVYMGLFFLWAMCAFIFFLLVEDKVNKPPRPDVPDGREWIRTMLRYVNWGMIVLSGISLVITTITVSAVCWKAVGKCLAWWRS
jgi:TRAP-type mannitol/chloroaromatic compound transport system permease small subunit